MMDWHTHQQYCLRMCLKLEWVALTRQASVAQTRTATPHGLRASHKIHGWR